MPNTADPNGIAGSCPGPCWIGRRVRVTVPVVPRCVRRVGWRGDRPCHTDQIGLRLRTFARCSGPRRGGLVLTADLTIVAASDAYLHATIIRERRAAVLPAAASEAARANAEGRA